MANEHEITVEIVMGADAAKPLLHAISLIEQIRDDVGYHPLFDKLQESIEVASDLIVVHANGRGGGT